MPAESSTLFFIVQETRYLLFRLHGLYTTNSLSSDAGPRTIIHVRVGFWYLGTHMFSFVLTTMQIAGHLRNEYRSIGHYFRLNDD